MAITYHAGRRIQGLDSEKPIDASTTEFYDQAIGNGSLDLYTDIPRLGVKAVSGNGTGHINKIKVWLRVIGTHTSTNPVYARVRKISDDSIVATATKTIADLTSGTTITEYEFDFGSCVEITSAEHYVLIEYAYGDASNYLGLTRYSGAVTGWEWTSYNGSSYTTNSTQSLSGTFSSQVGHVCSTGDVQVGSRFEATDTRKMYHYNSPTLTFEHDYSDSIGWIEVGTTSNITGGVWTSNGAGNNADHGFYKALGFTLSDSAWYVEFDIKQTAGGTTVASGVPLFFSAGTAKSLDTSHDALGITATSDGTKPVQAWKNTAGTAGTGSGATTLTHGTQYYGVLIRTSTTNLQLKYYTDSARTSQHGSTVDFTISSGITGLNTIQHRTTDNGSTSSGTSNIIDNVKIYNGVTSLDNVWSELGT
jgi:hypothetical protein